MVLRSLLLELLTHRLPLLLQAALPLQLLELQVLKLLGAGLQGLAVLMEARQRLHHGSVRPLHDNNPESFPAQMKRVVEEAVQADTHTPTRANQKVESPSRHFYTNLLKNNPGMNDGSYKMCPFREETQQK